MTVLTPELASAILDHLGEPSHLEAPREITLNEARRFLLNADQRHRLHYAAKRLGMPYEELVWLWTYLLRPTRERHGE